MITYKEIDNPLPYHASRQIDKLVYEYVYILKNKTETWDQPECVTNNQ